MKPRTSTAVMLHHVSSPKEVHDVLQKLKTAPAPFCGRTNVYSSAEVKMVRNNASLNLSSLDRIKFDVSLSKVDSKEELAKIESNIKFRDNPKSLRLFEARMYTPPSMTGSFSDIIQPTPLEGALTSTGISCPIL